MKFALQSIKGLIV